MATDLSLFSHAKVERALFVFRVLVALAILGGLLAAWLTGTPYWVDRSGKVVVALSLFLTYVQFRYEARLEAEATEATRRAKSLAEARAFPSSEVARVVHEVREKFRSMSEETRHTILVNALLMAGFGELVAAFGGFVFGLACGGHSPR